MTVRPPKAPAGVSDFHSQPGGICTDGLLLSLQEKLDDGLPADTFESLSEYADDDAIPDEPSDDYRQLALEYVTDCISYRDELRPDSLRDRADLPEGVHRVTAGRWVQYFNGNNVSHDRPASDAKSNTSGRYLLFSPDYPRDLEDILLEEFTQRPFPSAKIPTIPGKRDDWVLCLYQEDDRYWHDLRGEYHDPPSVRFRGFKESQKPDFPGLK